MRRPRFIAEHARNAHGVVGRAIAWIMERETSRENLGAIDALGVAAGHRVLDLGCGPGRSLEVLARRAPDVRVTGVDASPLMCELAASRSRALAHGQIDVVHASVEQLPFAAGAFDRVLCVHVVYFWSDLAAALREVARVTAPGGRWAFVLRTAAFRSARDFPREVYRFPALEDVRAAVAGVGFTSDSSEDEASDSLLLIAECARS